MLIIDAFVGPTGSDVDMLKALEERKNNIIIVANKVDKIKKSEYADQIKKIQSIVGNHAVIPYSSEKKIGPNNLIKEILK